MLDPLRLCHLDDIPEGAARGFDLKGEGRDSVFVVRKAGEVFAYRDACPHYQGATSLPWRKNAYLGASRQFIVCAAHGAEFEIDTGLCVHGPCLGESLTNVRIHMSEDRSIFMADTE